MLPKTMLLIAAISTSGISQAATCNGTVSGEKTVFWGDLHVHTAYSLDAYSFGTLQTPADAYAFAKGSELTMADGSRAKLNRPLDFAAVTDHAEWFDFLYLCTDPGMSDHPDCRNLRENASPTGGLELFRQYVVPSITLSAPEVLGPCRNNASTCQSAYLSQWQRVQRQAEAANDPCQFTSFIGYEWSATKNFRHTHRNVIFASARVPNEAFDYIRYPGLQQLFEQIDQHCRLEDGCDAITIPHNTNMGDGTTFDVEQDTDRQLQLRSRFERLVEVHQEKGNSECLSPLGVSDESDCSFEVRLTKLSGLAETSDFNSAEWEKMRTSYVRSLLLRGLAAYKRSGNRMVNPLQLGVIGSTDGHAATPGFVSEKDWHGPVFGLGSLDMAMSRMDWNPGGLIAIRAEENTRPSLFAAMKRREVYATSGPRITLNFEADTGSLTCSDNHPGEIPMGGNFKSGTPNFRATVAQDRTPLARIEVIKGTLEDGIFIESATSLWQGEAASRCITWQDPDFNADEPAFWYLRVRETASPRWTAHHCRNAGRCDEFPGADRDLQERAWSSPIWYLPVPLIFHPGGHEP